MMHIYYYGSELWKHILENLKYSYPKTVVLLNLNFFCSCLSKTTQKEYRIFSISKSDLCLRKKYM